MCVFVNNNLNISNSPGLTPLNIVFDKYSNVNFSCSVKLKISPVFPFVQQMNSMFYTL